jgi:hypothetical protein
MLSYHLRMYGIPKRFWSAARVPTVEQVGWPSRVPRSDIRGTEAVFIPLLLSDHNVRYNRK